MHKWHKKTTSSLQHIIMVKLRKRFEHIIVNSPRRMSQGNSREFIDPTKEEGDRITNFNINLLYLFCFIKYVLIL